MHHWFSSLAVIALATALAFRAEAAMQGSNYCMTNYGPAEWTGECVDDVAQGYGVASYDDNYRKSIEGLMIDGVPTGWVKVIYKRGGYYIGGMKDGHFHEHGVWIQEGGYGYIGNWDMGFRDGAGTYIARDGTRSPGIWRHGVLIGSWYRDPQTGCAFWWSAKNDPVGTATWSGDCVDGKAEGSGQVTWNWQFTHKNYPFNVTFEGTFRNGVIEGVGEWRERQTYENVIYDITYVGEYSEGEKNGHGVYRNISNQTKDYSRDSITEQYEGGFKNGKYSGNGEYSKERFEGENVFRSIQERGDYASGKLIGQGYRRTEFRSDMHSSIRIEEGLFDEGDFTGEGTLEKESTFDGHTTRTRVSRRSGENAVSYYGTANYNDELIFEGEFNDLYIGNPTKGYCKVSALSFSDDCEFNEQVFDSLVIQCMVPLGKTEPCLYELGKWNTDRIFTD